MWVARDESGILKLYIFYPVKCDATGVYSGTPNLVLDRCMFPQVTWESGPEEVALMRNEILEKIAKRMWDSGHNNFTLESLDLPKK